MPSDSKISGFVVHTLSDSLQIYSVFSLWRADSKISGVAAEFAGCVWTEAVSIKKKSCGFKNIWIGCRIRWMRVDGSCVQKEKSCGFKICGYVWTRLQSR